MLNERFIFKTASEPWEFEQIHTLYDRTFTEELRRHPTKSERRVSDWFHNENDYFICLQRNKLVAMMEIKRMRPFSLDETVGNLDSSLPCGHSVCEIRLLTDEPNFQHSSAFNDLLRFMAEEILNHEFSLAVISVPVPQQQLYIDLGFIAFSQITGEQNDMYQPMYILLQSLLNNLECLTPIKNKSAEPVSFLPVPVAISAKVRRAFNRRPVTHRSDTFRQLMNDTKALLLNLTGAAHVEILLGSGTLANDVVAAQLKLLDKDGLVLANGMFGERLIDHATRHGLKFKTFCAPWGEAFDYSLLSKKLSGGTIHWIWATHCETFLGTLNDLEKLGRICRDHDVKLCMDCISSVGTVPVQFNGVYLATTVSGKGLASYPGIAIVFYNHEAFPDSSLPIYLDLGYYRSKGGVPFTHSYNLVAALKAALLIVTANTRIERIRKESRWLRKELERFGIESVHRSADVSPAILTLSLPPSVSSLKLGEEMEAKGFLLSYRSDYLINNNLLRICLLGETSHNQHRQMLEELVRLYSRFAKSRVNEKGVLRGVNGFD